MKRIFEKDAESRYSLLIIFLFSLIGAISGFITYTRAVKYGYLATHLVLDILTIVIVFIFILWWFVKSRC